MIGEPVITVTCDRCGDEESFELTAVAGGGWDDRNLLTRMEKGGWRARGLEDICPSCVETLIEDEEIEP